MTDHGGAASPRTARKALIDLLDEGGYLWEEVHERIDAVVAQEAPAPEGLRAALTDLVAAVVCVPYHRHPDGGPCGYPDEGHRGYSCALCLALVQAEELIGPQPSARFPA